MCCKHNEASSEWCKNRGDCGCAALIAGEGQRPAVVRIARRQRLNLGSKPAILIHKMSELVLYHGSAAKSVNPQAGRGNDRHDYGRGFYLTENAELAKEWAVCRPDASRGYLHQFALDTTGLNIFNFEEAGVLAWLAELMKHRDASDTKRYRLLAAKFIAKYGVDTASADVIRGWRANASFFYIAKEFVRDNVDIDILEPLLSLGGLGIQFCVKSAKAYSQLREIPEGLSEVPYSEFNAKYNSRDAAARKAMRDLINSDANKVINVFSTLFNKED